MAYQRIIVGTDNGLDAENKIHNNFTELFDRPIADNSKLITYTMSSPQTIGTPYYYNFAKLPQGAYRIIINNY